MRETLKVILSIQELDVKMMRLMRVKKQRADELTQIDALQKELVEQLKNKEEEIHALQNECQLYEKKCEEHKERVKKLEGQQTSLKKLEEFNAITKEITTLEKEKIAFEQMLSNLVDKKHSEEELYEKAKKGLQETTENSKQLQAEIHVTIQEINREGTVLKQERDEIAKTAEPEIFKIYERLLRNKKDRVVVAVENRNCTGCHIALTAQHENLVRRGEKLVFCEHCSRIHYWAEESHSEEEAPGAKRRRRKATVTS